jgi:ATP/maltotriose-dependent transcriptional regulator MalT
MLHCPPADRDHELQLFSRLIIDQSRERILLLEADAGMGKTTLLKEFMLRCPSEITYAPIDLKGGTSGLHDIFYRLCDALGSDHFPAFQARVEHLGQVVLHKNTIIGRADIAVALQTPDQGDRLARRAELTRAFFDDLRPLKRRLLMIFDTFDEAAPDVQEWLQSSFLAFAHRTPHLRVIVAGRQVPEDSIEWATCCIRHRLAAVCEPELWQLYADRRGAVFHSQEWIAAFCDLLEGHPLEMAKAIARYIPRGG